MVYIKACQNVFNVDQPVFCDPFLRKTGADRTNGNGTDRSKATFADTRLRSRQVVVKDFTLDVLTYGTQTRTTWARLYESQQFCDVTLLVGEEEIPSHRVVLAVHSPVLSGQLEKQASVEDEHPRIRINLPDCVDSGATFKEVLRYMYRGTCRLTSDSVVALLHICNYYEVSSLKEACSRFLSELQALKAVGVSSDHSEESGPSDLPVKYPAIDPDGYGRLSNHPSAPQQGLGVACDDNDPGGDAGSVAGPTLADVPVDIMVNILADAPLAQLARLATLCRNMRGAYQERLKERHACIVERIKGPSSFGKPWTVEWQEDFIAPFSEEHIAVPRDLIVRPPIPERLQCTPHLNSQEIAGLPRVHGINSGLCVYSGFCRRGKPDGRGEWTEYRKPPFYGRVTEYGDWRQGKPHRRRGILIVM